MQKQINKICPECKSDDIWAHRTDHYQWMKTSQDYQVIKGDEMVWNCNDCGFNHFHPVEIEPNELIHFSDLNGNDKFAITRSNMDKIISWLEAFGTFWEVEQDRSDGCAGLTYIYSEFLDENQFPSWSADELLFTIKNPDFGKEDSA